MPKSFPEQCMYLINRIVMRTIFKFILLILICSCEQKKSDFIITDDDKNIYFSKKVIEQLMTTANKEDKIEYIRTFLQHKHVFNTTSDRNKPEKNLVPILEIKPINGEQNQLAVLIGDESRWEVSFMILVMNQERYQVVHHQEISSHYYSPQLQTDKNNFIILHHEIAGGTDFLDKMISIFYFDTLTGKLVTGIEIPENRNTAGKLKQQVTAIPALNNSELTVRMVYKFWICDGPISDPELDPDELQKSIGLLFSNCDTAQTITLLDDFSVFSFEWNPKEKQFILDENQLQLWQFFQKEKTRLSAEERDCEFYSTFEKSMKEFNPENTFIINRLINKYQQKIKLQ